VGDPGLTEIPSRSARGPAGEPHVRDYLRVLYARRWVLVTVFLIAVFTTLAIVLVQTPVYRPVCTLLLEPVRSRVMDIKEVYDPTFGAESGGQLLRREFLETQYLLILSRPNLERTFHEFHFERMPEFEKAKDPIGAFRKRFAVAGMPNSYLANVSFEWKDPELATRVLDFLVQQYIRSCRERSIGVTAEGLDALRAKAAEIRPKLEAKAEELQGFIVKHNMVSLEETQDIIVERLKTLSQNLNRAEAQRIQAQGRYESVRAALEQDGVGDAMPEVISSQTIRDLKLEYIRAKLKHDDLSERLGPNHPEVRTVRASLEAVRSRLEAEIRSVLQAAEVEYLRAKREEDELRRVLSEQERAVMEFNRLAAEYRILKDAHEALSRSHRAVTERIEEIEIALAAGPKQENVYVVAKPVVPNEPVKPRKKRALALAGVLGLLLGTATCFTVEYFDTSIKTKEDVETALGAPFLGFVPVIGNGRASKAGPSLHSDRLLLEHPRSGAAEAFRTIRTSLAFARAGGECRQFVVTSPLPSEGKTLVSVNLAVALAKAGKRVLLVDADLRRPRVHSVFGLAQAPGLTNLLAGDETYRLKEVTRTVEIPNLFVVTSGPLPPNPSELLGGPRMSAILAEASGAFDYLIFDTPPAVNVTDAAVLGQQVKAAVLVVRSFQTDRMVAARACEIIASSGAELLGVVLNRVDVSHRGYRYYGYYRYAREGYTESPMPSGRCDDAGAKTAHG